MTEGRRWGSIRDSCMALYIIWKRGRMYSTYLVYYSGIKWYKSSLVPHKLSDAIQMSKELKRQKKM